MSFKQWLAEEKGISNKEFKTLSSEEKSQYRKEYFDLTEPKSDNTSYDKEAQS